MHGLEGLRGEHLAQLAAVPAGKLQAPPALQALRDEMCVMTSCENCRDTLAGMCV